MALATVHLRERCFQFFVENARPDQMGLLQLCQSDVLWGFYIFREHVCYVHQQLLQQLGYQQKDAGNGQISDWRNSCGIFVKIAEVYRKKRKESCEQP